MLTILLELLIRFVALGLAAWVVISFILDIIIKR
jgi:hypothetical protein